MAYAHFELWGKWLIYGSLNCCTIMELELDYQQFGKWDEMPYIQAFILLYNRSFPRSEFQKVAGCPCKPKDF